MARFPYFQQFDANDCGPASLKMIAAFYGKHVELSTLRDKCFVNHDGVSLLGISQAAESIYFRTEGVLLAVSQLSEEANLPCILHWDQNHIVVLYKIKNGKFYVADPAIGKVQYTEKEFIRHWGQAQLEDEPAGVALLLELTPDFNAMEGEPVTKNSVRFLLHYLSFYRRLIVQLFAGIFVLIGIQLVFPFLFQTMIDNGVVFADKTIVGIVFFAQIILIISRFLIGFARNWMVLHLASRINIAVLSDYITKLIKLPLSFFESKTIGDFIQRINDHRRIEHFLTTSGLQMIISFITLIVLGVVLAIFSIKLLLVYLLGTALYLFWIYLYMPKRRVLDQRKFLKQSENQSVLINIIDSIADIKLNNNERMKRWEWESLQASIFKLNIRSLMLQQKQEAGALFFMELKDVLIVFLGALLVMKGGLTIGALLAVAYIIGQMSSPLDKILQYIYSVQDANLSLARLAEVHEQVDEETNEQYFYHHVPEKEDICFHHVSYQYEGPASSFALKDVQLSIPRNKITAIVGTSGSGKTTLLKILLGLYEPTQGEVLIGKTNLKAIVPKVWRDHCGAVLQDGALFSGTIADNILMGVDSHNQERLKQAILLSNVDKVVNNMPLGYNTRIGPQGSGLSQGQKQRILIARALYKRPSLLVFDEATNALDAQNENEILTKLQQFYTGRTVVVAAHRLSTVRNADKIIVINDGQVVEQGRHHELIDQKGLYFNLVKNQLEISG